MRLLPILPILAIAVLFSARTCFAEPLCNVQVCNRIERWSVSIWTHLKDHWGESCYQVEMPKSEAVEGKVLDSQSKWFQGSHVNFTKKSVTRIKKVLSCHE